jgi:ABC-type phosphate/phosphonate transport system substrate-binding protein
VPLRTASSFGGFLDNVVAGRYDIILIQPFDYVLATKQGYLPVVRMRDDLEAAVFVRADSRFHRLADLKGERVAMPPLDSAMSRLGRAGLRMAGLGVNRDITIDYRPNHDSCLQQVQHAQAAACVTSTHALTVVPGELTAGLHAIADLGTAPGVVILAHRRVPDAVRERLRREMLSWADSESGRQIMTASRLGPFAPVDPADYQRLPAIEDLR